MQKYFTIKIAIASFIFILFITDLSLATSKLKQYQKIKIEITTHLGDKQTFLNGDIVKFLVNLDTDSYLTVIYQDAKGQLIQLIPNQKQSNFYKAGLFITLLNESSNFRFKIQAPYGDEYIWIFASDESNNELEGTKIKNGLILLSSSIEKIRTQIHEKANIKFGQAHLELHTKSVK